MDPETIDLSALEPEEGGHALAMQELNAELIRFQRMMHAMKARLARSGPENVDPGALGVLTFLTKEGGMRQSDLAACLMLDPSTVSRHVRQLVEHGLVERRPHPEDGRAVQLAPTETGRAAFERVRQARLSLMSQILADWPAEDVSTFARLIGRFADDASQERSLDLR